MSTTDVIKVRGKSSRSTENLTRRGEVERKDNNHAEEVLAGIKNVMTEAKAPPPPQLQRGRSCMA
jgi:hypothetical protein